MAKKRNVFSPEFAPYGRYSDGLKGSPNNWRAAFEERFSKEEIKEILGDDNPWKILGLAPGASQEQVKQAYRDKAKETHPDFNPGKDGAEFRKVRAAYEQLYFK